jgi:uncharacterized membrane protein
MTTATVSLDASTGTLVEKARISSIDLVRGMVMVIMALDHTRDFFHQGSLGNSDPTDMATTTPVFFFTRWITHFCAPSFVMLAGTSIFLNSQKKSKKDLSMFLLTRGFWLILLEVVVIRFSFFFNLYYDITIFQVIWVIGGSMVCMAALIHLSNKIILGLGLLIVFGHNLTDSIQLNAENALFPVWAFLHQTGFIAITEGVNLFVFYPLLPWLGIMLLGYSLGRIFTKEFDRERRRQLLFLIGGIAILLFIIIRASNMYGDPAPWAAQKNFVFTLMSFINCTKYPPSLLYTLMTLGPVLIILALLEKSDVRFFKPFVVFGRVPLFYYILHFYLIHAVSLFFFMRQTGKSFSDIDFHFGRSFGGLTSEGGFSLGITYIFWISIVVFLYPLCNWYNRYKSTHSNRWLSYL